MLRQEHLPDDEGVSSVYAARPSFDGAVAQLVEHLLCKKNAQSAVLDHLLRRKPVSEIRPIRCSSNTLRRAGRSRRLRSGGRRNFAPWPDGFAELITDTAERVID